MTIQGKLERYLVKGFNCFNEDFYICKGGKKGTNHPF
jgi:hypothetical protein